MFSKKNFFVSGFNITTNALKTCSFQNKIKTCLFNNLKMYIQCKLFEHKCRYDAEENIRTQMTENLKKKIQN